MTGTAIDPNVPARKFGVPCCPDLKAEEVCDSLDFNYRLIHTANVDLADRRQRVAVEVIIHVRLERCSGELALGDLAYSTTLLPGEKVRLFTLDRRTRFSFDSESSLSYRREQTSEENYYMSSMSDFMSDVTVRDEGRATNSRQSDFESHGETNGVLGAIFSGPSVDVSGSYDSQSTSTFLRELSSHAESSHNRSVTATRTASSVSIGEVQTRSHAEGETEDHFESASRVVANPNRCHSVTFFFYRINKVQTVRLKVVAIRRRVIDPAADTRLTNRPPVAKGEVSVIPSAILATSANRLEVERTGRAAAAASVVDAVRLSPGAAFDRSGATATLAAQPTLFSLAGLALGTVGQTQEPLPAEVREAALKQVDDGLVKEKILDRNGAVADGIRAEVEFERTTVLPTPGLLVRGCLDDCDVCEPSLKHRIDLELERQRLENDLLRRRIDLLDKSQEYRCCPAGEEEEGEE